MEVPGGGDGQIAIAIVIPIVVDLEAGSIEVAEVDAVAVRIHIICQLSPGSLEIKVYCL